MQNGEVQVRWYLSSFAPPYVKVCLVFLFFLLFLFADLIYHSSEVLAYICCSVLLLFNSVLGHRDIDDLDTAFLSLSGG